MINWATVLTSVIGTLFGAFALYQLSTRTRGLVDAV